jgi:nitroreductase
MLRELVDKNRSHREFKSGVEMTEEMICEWILNASHCPAAMNLQALKYKILTRPEEVAALLPLTRWAASLEKKLPPDGHGPSAFIIMCHDTDIAPMKPIFMMDVGICAQTIMLSATEAGFGGCIIGSGASDKLSEALSLPNNLVPVLVLGLGIPEDEVVLTEASDGNTKYYRDENNVHYVPKRSLDEIMIR